MSTRSFIGHLNDDGTVTSVYCHSDGYPSWTGAKLLTHWNDSEAAVLLVSGGDMSQLGDDFESTIFYGRDRGIFDVGHLDCPSEYYVEDAKESGAEYIYLHTPEGWKMYEDGTETFQPLTKFVKLTPAQAAERKVDPQLSFSF